VGGLNPSTPVWPALQEVGRCSSETFDLHSVQRSFGLRSDEDNISVTTPPPPVRRHHQIAASARDQKAPKKKTITSDREINHHVC